MKKYIAFGAYIALLFSIGISGVFAAPPPMSPPPVMPPPPPIYNCHNEQTCVVYVNNEFVFQQGDGTSSKPYRTITKAVDHIKNNAD